ncbi:MAG: homoserine O-acetyltransferase MetX [Kiritimatiellia bacterium]|jgi:homoserine O-acetyltransferase
MQTPPLITETKTIQLQLPAEGLKLEHGGLLPEIHVAYETCGTLSPTKDNVIFICHALTGDAHVAGMHEGEEKPSGWWSNMIRPGGGIDTDKYFVICANILGGCKGTTGPASTNPATGKPYGSAFPEISVGDIVDVHKLFLEQIGFQRIYAVVGGSFGGMQAAEFAVRHPGFCEKCVLIATGPSLTTQALAFDIVGREAIVNDPHWRGGDYYDGERPNAGLAQARKLAHITYLSNEMMKEKFGRRIRTLPKDSIQEFSSAYKEQFEVESYLAHQGRKFIARFDANSYLRITEAMDYYDLAAGFKTLTDSVARSASRTLIVAFSGDWLFLPRQSEIMARAFHAAKKEVSYFCLPAEAGHDAFLTHIDQLVGVLGDFLTMHPVPPSTRLPEEKEGDYAKLIDMMPRDIGSVLDLACSDGSLLARIAARHPGISCTGIDIDGDGLGHVLRAGHDAILADVDEGLQIIPNNTFDCAVLSESIQVMKHPDKALDELLRVAPVGLVSFPNFGLWKVRLALLFRGRMPKTKRLPYSWYDTPNIHLCTVRDFVDLCEEKDVEIESVAYLATHNFSKFLIAIGLKNLGASRVLLKIRRKTAEKKKG